MVNYALQVAPLPPAQPVRPPRVPLLRRGWFKALLIILGIILVASATGLLVYKDAIFQSTWLRDLNAWVLKYNDDAKHITADGKNIGAASSDVEGILSYLKYTPDMLSSQDLAIKDKYQICFEGRKKAFETIANASNTEQKYTEGAEALLGYDAELANFNMLKENKTSLDAVVSTKESALALKTYSDSASEIFGFNSLASTSIAYSAIADTLSQMEVALSKKNTKLLKTLTERLDSQIESAKVSYTEVAAEKTRWYEENIKVNYTKGSTELEKMRDACTQAELASSLQKEHTQAMDFMNRIKGR